MDTVHFLIYETCILYNYMTAFITRQLLYKRATESAERAQPIMRLYVGFLWSQGEDDMWVSNSGVRARCSDKR